MNRIPLCVHADHIFFVHSFADRYLGWLHNSATKTSAGVNRTEYTFLLTSAHGF